LHTFFHNCDVHILNAKHLIANIGSNILHLARNTIFIGLRYVYLLPY
jgi:hypothetical protein